MYDRLRDGGTPMQKNNREHRLFFCKKCLTSFDDRHLRYKLHGEEALARHCVVCSAHKSILPILPPAGCTLEFSAYIKPNAYNSLCTWNLRPFS